MQRVTPLRQVLDAEGRRQSWLADLVGVDRADMNRAVNRGMHLGDDKHQAIADALNRRVEELFPPLTADEQQAA
jgi:hypothetical protein